LIQVAAQRRSTAILDGAKRLELLKTEAVLVSVRRTSLRICLRQAARMAFPRSQTWARWARSGKLAVRALYATRRGATDGRLEEGEMRPRFYGEAHRSDHRPPCPQALPERTQTRDMLIVWKLDRLGRSLRDLITMLDELRDRGVKFRSLTEAIDTETPTGPRAMLDHGTDLNTPLVVPQTVHFAIALQAYAPCVSI
jgi:hypothetical protein